MGHFTGCTATRGSAESSTVDAGSLRVLRAFHTRSVGESQTAAVGHRRRGAPSGVATGSEGRGTVRVLISHLLLPGRSRAVAAASAALIDGGVGCLALVWPTASLQGSSTRAGAALGSRGPDRAKPPVFIATNDPATAGQSSARSPAIARLFRSRPGQPLDPPLHIELIHSLWTLECRRGAPSDTCQSRQPTAAPTVAVRSAVAVKTARLSSTMSSGGSRGHADVAPEHEGGP